MIDQSKITAALQGMLNDSRDVSAFLSQPVDRNEYINQDPNRCPWIGVYRGHVSYTPRTLGRHSATWKATISPVIVMQHVNWESPETCESEMEGYIEKVMSAVWADPTLGNTVDMLTGFEIAYDYQETDKTTMYYQQAVITLNAEARTG